MPQPDFDIDLVVGQWDRIASCIVGYCACWLAGVIFSDEKVQW